MRVVIDSNRVQSPELDQFLSAAPSHRAVVTDWLMMEAYKGDTAKSIYKSMSVLAKHPRQVIVLKNTGQCMCRPVGPQMANRLIWSEITDQFPLFIRQIEAGRDGDRETERLILERGRIATERIQGLLEEASFFMQGNRAMFESLTRADVAAIRGATVVPPDILSRVFGIAFDVADGLRRSLDPPVAAPRPKDMTQDFLFRVGLGITSSFLEWVRTGSEMSVKPEKIRNDHVDMMLSVYGTYFNGVMTADAKLRRVHSLNRALLGAMRVSLSREYRAPASV